MSSCFHLLHISKSLPKYCISNDIVSGEMISSWIQNIRNSHKTDSMQQSNKTNLEKRSPKIAKKHPPPPPLPLFIFVCWCKFFNWIWYFNNVDKVEFDILTMFNKDALSSPVLFGYIKDCYLSYILVCVCSSILPRVCAPWHIYYIDSLHIEWNISGLYFLKFWWLWFTDNEIIIRILHKINKKRIF